MVEVFGAFTRALREADLEKCEEYLLAQASWPAETGDRARSADRHSPVRAEGYTLRSDRSHANYNGAQVTGVEKREVKIPLEIQKQAVDLDEEVFGVALRRAPAGGGAVAAAAQ